MKTKIEMNASEALYGFAGWLTGRDKPVTAGANHDCAIWAELVEQFIKANDLTPVRDDVWPDNLHHPKSQVEE